MITPIFPQSLRLVLRLAARDKASCWQVGRYSAAPSNEVCRLYVFTIFDILTAVPGGGTRCSGDEDSTSTCMCHEIVLEPISFCHPDISYRPIYIKRSDVTESVVATRSPFCGYNTIQCVELNGENISCYSNKIESVIWRKCSYDHWLTKKAYLSAITVTNISRSFTYKMTTKVNWQSPYEYDIGFPAM